MPLVLLFPYTLMASYYQNLPFILSEGFLWHTHMHVRGRARCPGNSPQPVMDTQLYNLLGHTTLGHIPQHLPGLSLPHPHLQIEPQLPPAVKMLFNSGLAYTPSLSHLPAPFYLPHKLFAPKLHFRVCFWGNPTSDFYKQVETKRFSALGWNHYIV